MKIVLLSDFINDSYLQTNSHIATRNEIKFNVIKNRHFQYNKISNCTQQKYLRLFHASGTLRRNNKLFVSVVTLSNVEVSIMYILTNIQNIDK